MTTNLTINPEAQRDRQEQAAINLAIALAIPEDAKLTNILTVLLRLASEFTKQIAEGDGKTNRDTL